MDYFEHLREGTLDWQRPFFILVTFSAPHAPLQLPPGRDLHESITRMKPGPERDRAASRAIFAHMVEDLDESIGRILDGLEREGLERDTLVFFSSDNGAGLEYGGSNGLLRGEKFTTFEGGVRVPAILRWPGGLVAGQVSHDLISHIDVLPTLAGAAGVEIPPELELDGWNRLDAIRRSGSEPREALFFGVKRGKEHYWSARKGDLKLVDERLQDSVVRTFLFDVRHDPFEELDLTAEQPGALAELRASLEPWKQVPTLSSGSRTDSR